MFTSEKISAKDFVEQLNSGKFNSDPHIFGKVKKSKDDSEILFAFKGDKSNWVTIPVNMIEHVHLLKSFTCEGEKMALVKIHLKEASDPQSKLYLQLLSTLQAKVMKWHMKKMMMGYGMGSGSCGMKNSSEGRCGCNSSSCEMEKK